MSTAGRHPSQGHGVQGLHHSAWSLNGSQASATAAALPVRLSFPVVPSFPLPNREWLVGRVEEDLGNDILLSYMHAQPKAQGCGVSRAVTWCQELQRG